MIYTFSLTFYTHLFQVKSLIKYKGQLTWYSVCGTFISMMIDSNIRPIVVAQMANIVAGISQNP